LCCFTYGSEILSKNWDIWNTKFQQNSTVYYLFFIFLAFLAFCFLFHLSKLVQKLWNFFVVFDWNGYRFYQRFLENCKSSFKKILICEIFIFSKILRFTICFFYFFIIFDILFSISSICTCQQILEIFMFFFCFMD